MLQQTKAKEGRLCEEHMADSVSPIAQSKEECWKHKQV